MQHGVQLQGIRKAFGTTTVLITHRLSALAVVGKIMVLKDGMLAAFGPRDEVLEAMKAKAQAAAPPAPASAVTPMPAAGARALS